MHARPQSVEQNAKISERCDAAIDCSPALVSDARHRWRFLYSRRPTFVFLQIVASVHGQLKP
jgi:hypothetical protein